MDMEATRITQYNLVSWEWYKTELITPTEEGSLYVGIGRIKITTLQILWNSFSSFFFY